MNERIRQLAIEAGFHRMGIWKIIGIEEYHQQFAELIVRDCLAQVDKVDAMLKDDKRKQEQHGLDYQLLNILELKNERTN